MITIQPTGGLSNYLRVVFSYYEYTKSLETQLTVVWGVTPACNGNFLDFFEEIPNINFVSKLPPNTKLYYVGCSQHPLFKPNYNCLKLRPHMRELINKRINILEKNYISIHVRRTDHIELAKKNNRYSNDEEFFEFIDKFTNKNVYIATDNIHTYNIFKKKYNMLIKFDYHKTNPMLLRHTSLSDAIVDIYVCVFGSDFMGSGWSSFSDLIKLLRSHKEFIKL